MFTAERLLVAVGTCSVLLVVLFVADDDVFVVRPLGCIGRGSNSGGNGCGKTDAGK